MFFFFFDKLEQESGDQVSQTSANKGEWSEIYTMFKLLADGRLYDGDESYNKKPNSYYPILQILREEQLRKGKNDYRYEIEDNERPDDRSTKTIAIYENGELVMKLTSDNFVAASEQLFNDIINGRGRSFKTSAANEAFMKKIHCKNIKRDADHKADITIHLYDAVVGRRPVVAFSIKSLIGDAPTLLNTSDATLITYSVKGCDLSDAEIEEINSITGNSKLKRRLQAIYAKGASIEFKAFDSQVFMCNLQLIDYGLPTVLASCVLKYFSSERISMVRDLAAKVAEDNPLGYCCANREQFYIEKMTKLLVASALGMYPSKQYNGENEANGYIVVKENGELVCYHFYDMGMVRRHLLENTKFDTPASSKMAKDKVGNPKGFQRKPYCVLYRNGEGELEIKLNFQIRWT